MISTTRRQFFAGLAACAIAPASVIGSVNRLQPQISVEQALAELKIMVGLQEQMSHHSIYLPNDALGFLFLTEWSGSSGSSGSYDAQHSGIRQRWKVLAAEMNVCATIPQWRIEAARRICMISTNELLTEDRFYTPDLPVEKYQHILVRASNRIAKRTRRGCGNLIIGSKEGIRQLHLPPNQKMFRRFISFEEGEVSPKPFAVIGYAGLSPYDHSIGLALRKPLENSVVGGFAVSQKVSEYWIRLV